MTLMLRGCAAAVLACLSSAQPALATNDRVPVQAHVSRAGLDLTAPAGRAMLAARIRSAAAIACGSSGHDLRDDRDSARCRDEMVRDGAAQIAAFQGVRVASIRP